LIVAKVVKNFAYIKLIIYRENGSFLIVIQKENFSIFDKKIEKNANYLYRRGRFM